MTGLEAMRYELNLVQIKMIDCVTESGHVKTSCRETYNELVKQAQSIKEGIDWLEALDK